MFEYSGLGYAMLREALLAGAVVFLAYRVWLVVYNLYFHPLARYPGPTLWVISRLPYVISLQRGKLVHDTKAIHDRYGLVVRLAPNELSYIDERAWQDIYGHRKKGHEEFEKNPIWAHETPNGVRSLINAHEKDHPRMRKPLAPAFSPKAIRECEPTIHSYIDLMMIKLSEKVEAGASVVDMKDYFNWLVFDIFGDLGFGEPFDCLRNQHYHEWVSFLYSHLKAAALKASVNFYPWAKVLLRATLPNSTFKQALHHHNMSAEKAHRRMALDVDRKDIMSYMLRLDGEKGMSIKEIEATAAVLILAGSESTSTLLTAFSNLAVRNPEKLKKLTREIRSTFAAEDEITLDRVERLPYLGAVLEESLRFAPPIPTAIPRIVPPGGDVVCGEVMPEGTFLGVHQYAAYHSVLNFKYPDSFIPERWLPEDHPLNTPSPSDPPFGRTTFAGDNKAVMKPFSVGPRNCVGATLAWAEMRIIVARLVWRFDLAIAPGREGFVFEEQETYALWQRDACMIQLAVPAGRSLVGIGAR